MQLCELLTMPVTSFDDSIRTSPQAYTAKKISVGSAAAAAAAATSRGRPAAAASAVAAPRAAVRPLRSEPTTGRPLRSDPAPRPLRPDPAPRPVRSEPVPRPTDQSVPVRTKRTSDVADDGNFPRVALRVGVLCCFQSLLFCVTDRNDLIMV